MFRIAAVITHATQHHGPMFRELAKVPGVELKVFFCSRIGQEQSHDPGFGKSFAWDVPLTSGYDHVFVPTKKSEIKSTDFGEIDNPVLPKMLEEFRPHAMWINGYGCRSYWRAANWARGKSAVLCFCDSELVHHRNALKKWVKKFVVKRFYSKCSGFITIGDNNEDYYRYYGVQNERMTRGCYPVDVERFERTIEQAPTSKAEIRSKLGIPNESLTAAFMGKMIDIKRPFDLIKAVANSKRVSNIHAIFIGSGELYAEADKLRKELNVSDRVHLLGFVNQTEIPLYLAASDVIAMCSEKDPHPLAITEAMIAGNAVIASSKIGCVGKTDSAREGVNTLVYECGNVDQLAKCLERLAADGPLLTKMKKASRIIAQAQDKRVTVRAVLVAIDKLRKEFSPLWNDVEVSCFETLKRYSQMLPAPDVTIEN